MEGKHFTSSLYNWSDHTAALKALIFKVRATDPAPSSNLGAVRNAECQAPPQTCQMTIYILTNSPRD